jgi:hypothetical protein
MGPEEVAAGDVLVMSHGVHRQAVPPEVLGRFTLARTIEPPRRVPLRTMLDIVGFYGQLPWDVPYGATRRPELDHFEVLVAR